MALVACGFGKGLVTTKKVTVFKNVQVIAANPTKFIVPRLPLSVLLNGKFQMIPEDKVIIANYNWINPYFTKLFIFCLFTRL